MERCDKAALLGEEMARRHVEQGPDGPIERSAKPLAALLHLCGLWTDCKDWLDSCRPDVSTQRLLALDLHHADKIAEVWRRNLGSALFAAKISLHSIRLGVQTLPELFQLE
jgi:hypothetical protein